MNKTCDTCVEYNGTEESLAREMIKTERLHGRRWFVVALIELSIIFAIFVGIYIFFSTTEISSASLNTDGGGNANYIEDSEVGDINNGENKGAENLPKEQEENKEEIKNN